MCVFVQARSAVTNAKMIKTSLDSMAAPPDLKDDWCEQVQQLRQLLVGTCPCAALFLHAHVCIGADVRTDPLLSQLSNVFGFGDGPEKISGTSACSMSHWMNAMACVPQVFWHC